MPGILRCPQCRRPLRVPDELLSTPVRCPTCSRTFTANAADVIDEPPEEVTALSFEEPPPEQLLETQPYPPPRPSSARRDARVDDEERGPARRSSRRGSDGFVAPHRAGSVLTLGILSLVLGPLGLLLGWCCLPIGLLTIVGFPLGIMAWSMGSRDLREMRKGRMDAAGLSGTNSGYVCGIIGTIVGGLGLLLLLLVIGAALLGLALPAGMKVAPHFRF
jgi:hypothetical protein